MNEDGDVSLEEIEKKITPKTKVIAITHLSNVTGINCMLLMSN